MGTGVTLLVVRVFLPFAAGYFISYLYRVVNAVIASDLVADTGIGPADLGLLTATYFITFAAFQLPLGVLLDRFGPRRTEAVLLVFAALGAFIFARATSLTTLIVGRALIGFGVSACLMAAFKAYTLWFSRDKWPMINGFQMASGGLGALAATAPVEYMLGFTDWRAIFLGLAATTLAVALAVFFVVPEKRTRQPAEPLSDQLRGVRQVFTSLRFWQAAPVTTASQAGFLSIQGLWAGPWLRDVALLDRSGVAGLLFLVAAAMICGFIVLGSLAARLGRHGVPIITSAVCGMVFFMLIQSLVIFGPLSWTTPVWLLFGFFGTSGIIAYAALSQTFPVELSGRVTTAVNLLVFVTAFCSQWAIGAIIELWPIAEDGTYAEAGYRTGFLIMLIIQIISVAWYFLAGQMLRRQTEAG